MIVILSIFHSPNDYKNYMQIFIKRVVKDVIHGTLHFMQQ